MDLRSVQKPFKERYRSDPGTARITLKAQGSQTETPIACSVDIGRALYQAQAHSGVGEEVPVGFETIRVRFEIDAPEATVEQLHGLHEKTEQYCVVMQTLTKPPKLEVDWSK